MACLSLPFRRVSPAARRSFILDEIADNAYRSRRRLGQRMVVRCLIWLTGLFLFYWFSEANGIFFGVELGNLPAVHEIALVVLPLLISVVSTAFIVKRGWVQNSFVNNEVAAKGMRHFIQGLCITGVGCAVWIVTEMSCDQVVLLRYFPGHFIWHCTASYGMTMMLMLGGILRADNFSKVRAAKSQPVALFQINSPSPTARLAVLRPQIAKIGRPKRKRRSSIPPTSSSSSLPQLGTRGFFRSLTNVFTEDSTRVEIASGAYSSRLKNLYFALLPEFALVEKTVDVRTGFQAMAADAVEQVHHVYKENVAANMRRWHLKAVRSTLEPKKRDEAEAVRDLGLAARALHRVGAIGRAGRAVGAQMLTRGTGSFKESFTGGSRRVLPSRFSPRKARASTTSHEPAGAGPSLACSEDAVHSMCISQLDAPEDVESGASGSAGARSASSSKQQQEWQHQQQEQQRRASMEPLDVEELDDDDEVDHDRAREALKRTD